MSSQNYMGSNMQDDIEKKLETEEDPIRIDELKKKLYSNVTKTAAVRERSFKPHTIDVGKNWQETDEKQAKLQAEKAERERIAKLGISGDNYSHHGSSLYGHFSPAEEVLRKKGMIDTSLEQKEAKKPYTPPESIGSFLSDKFADKRAAEAQKKLAASEITMKYAASQIEKEIYPHINTESAQESVTEPSSIQDYHPNFSVLTVGKTILDDMSREETHPSSRPYIQLSQSRPVETEEVSTEGKKRSTFAVTLFISICVFFLAALGYTYIFFKKGTSVVSPDKVEIVVTGPISVKSGEINDFSIDITNRNLVDLTLSDLVIEYPPGTASAADSSQLITNDRISLGTIASGETVRHKASAIFFGEENVKKNIKYALEFSIPDSTNIFSATKDIAVVISGSPVTARIVNVKEVTNNQDLSFDIEIQSNTEEVVKNIQLQVEYPFGYKLLSTNVEPAYGNNTWNIGDIAALDTKTIQLTGKLIGTSNLEKNFRFILGVADVKTGEMTSVLSTRDQKVTIQKPFVTTTLSLDGSVQEIKPVLYQDIIKGDIVFTNNLNVPITDVVVEVALQGVLIDRTSIKAHDGFYRSSDDIMFWDKSQQDRLASIDPGESREISFNMSIIKSKESLIASLRKSAAGLSVTIRAKRLNEKLVPEEIVSIITQELRLETDLGFQSGISHLSGPFKNTGSFPPRINQETTYTYTGVLTNTANTLKDVIFIAKLPPNATWKNVYSPTLSPSSVSYSPGKKEIYIKVGDIPAGTGIDAKAKEFSFQLGFTPSLTELGTAPILISDLRVSGIDTFTGRYIERKLEGLTIIPTKDVNNVGDGRIVE